MIKSRCPECGELLDVFKHVAEVVRVYVDDVGKGLKLYESELRNYKITTYHCGECNYRLPCRTDEDVVNFILKNLDK